VRESAWKKTSLTQVAAPRFADMAREDRAPEWIIETGKKKRKKKEVRP
jgi:hypothetical protein